MNIIIEQQLDRITCMDSLHHNDINGLDQNARKSGILLHISSLPAEDGVGSLGRPAEDWIDFLCNTGMTYWQILPLNPTGYGNSPYQGLSAFAGNPIFIDLHYLMNWGLLSASDLLNRPTFPEQRVDFIKVLNWKKKILKIAFENFGSDIFPEINSEMQSFLDENAYWVHDYALFMAIRDHFNGSSWEEWPDPYRKHDLKTMIQFQKENNARISYHLFLQYCFTRQLDTLKQYAQKKGIQLIGDIPIFMGYDSADVWSHPELFDLDAALKPSVVAGVPPDYFSKTGQLWGNPLYDWQQHQSDEFSWWVERITHALKSVDLIRLDHFRGFAAYFRIPSDAPTAESGKWVEGPGEVFFEAIKSNIGSLPFIAEDLGVITPDVIALREKFDLPGMRLLQFAFSGNADNDYLPHNYPENCVAYTGTHDNNTSAGWYRHLPPSEKQLFKAYLGKSRLNVPHAMIHLIWQSSAAIAIAPMQDFLRLGSKARMNLPASTFGNWEWRMRPDAITEPLVQWVTQTNITCGRVNKSIFSHTREISN